MNSPQHSKLQVYDGDSMPSVDDLYERWNAYVTTILDRGFDVEITVTSGETVTFQSTFYTYLGSDFKSVRRGQYLGKHELYATNSDYRFTLSKPSEDGKPWISERVTLNDPEDDFRHDIRDSGFFWLIPSLSDFSIFDLARKHKGLEFSVREMSSITLENEPCLEAEFVIQYDHDPQDGRLLTVGMSHYVTGRVWLMKNHFLLPKKIDVLHFERNNSGSKMPDVNQRTESRIIEYETESGGYIKKITTKRVLFGQKQDIQEETITCTPTNSTFAKEECRLSFYGLPEPVVPDKYSQMLWRWAICVIGVAIVAISYWLQRRFSSTRTAVK